MGSKSGTERYIYSDLNDHLKLWYSFTRSFSKWQVKEPQGH